MSDLDAIAARHVVIDGHCQGDGPGLPCDVVPLLDELAALRSQRDALAGALTFVADWCHDCSDGDTFNAVDDSFYGFTKTEALVREALARSIEP